MDQFYIRTIPKEEDMPFIYATWLKGQRRVGHFGLMDNRTYFSFQKVFIEALLDKSEIAMIQSTEETDHILGYLVHEKRDGFTMLHYAHMKQAFRSLGIMKKVVSRLYPTLGVEEFAITATTPEIQRRISGNKSVAERNRLRFNPYLVEILKDENN